MFAMILSSPNDNCHKNIICYGMNQIRQHYLLILKYFPAIFLEDFVQHHINPNRGKKGKKIKIAARMGRESKQMLSTKN